MYFGMQLPWHQHLNSLWSRRSLSSSVPADSGYIVLLVVGSQRISSLGYSRTKSRLISVLKYQRTSFPYLQAVPLAASTTLGTCSPMSFPHCGKKARNLRICGGTNPVFLRTWGRADQPLSNFSLGFHSRLPPIPKRQAWPIERNW